MCLPALLLIWLWMLLYWRPSLTALPTMDRREFAPFGWQEYYVSAVTGLTVSLWCTFQNTEGFFGSLGLIGLIPVVLFYGSGLLSSKDFKRMDW